MIFKKITLVSICLVFILFGCKDNVSNPTSEKVDKTLGKQIKVTDGYLVFSSFDDFIETRDKLGRKTPTEREKWPEKFTGFTSYNLNRTKINDQNSREKDPQEKLELIPIVGSMINEEGIVKINELYYIFSSKNLKVIKNGNENLITQAKKVDKSTKTIDVIKWAKQKQITVKSGAQAEGTLDPPTTSPFGPKEESPTFSASWRKDRAEDLEPKGVISAKATAYKQGIREYKRVSPCPNGDDFENTPIYCWVYDGISYSTSIFVEAYTTETYEVTVPIPGFGIGTSFPVKDAKKLRVSGTVSFPELGRYSENFNETFITDDRPSGIPQPDYSPSYTKHQLYYFGDQVDINDLSISLRFADLDKPKRESYVLNPAYPNNTFQLFYNISL